MRLESDFCGSLRRHFFAFASNAVSQRRRSAQVASTRSLFSDAFYLSMYYGFVGFTYEDGNQKQVFGGFLFMQRFSSLDFLDPLYD